MKRIISISLLLFLTLFVRSTIAVVWYVNSDIGSDTNPGTVSAPLASIGSAVNLSLDGDIIRVAEGAYQEEVLVQGFDGLVISGGWNADFSLQDPVDHETIMHDPDPSANTIAFSFLSSINCTLEGFMIQDFFWGVYSLNERTDIDRSAVIAVNVLNNRIINPRHYGIYFRSSYMLIEGNDVIGSGDSAIAGHSDYSITHADIIGNYVQGSRYYGLYLIGFKPWYIFNNFVIGNGAAGLNLNYYGYPKYVFNNTILYNDGPGIRAGYVPYVIAKNNIIAYNNDYGLKVGTSGYGQSGYNLLFDNYPDDYDDYWPPASTDLLVDPELDPEAFLLTNTSPAIDSGLDLTTTTYPKYPVTDYFNTPRIVEAGGDGLYDIGAHEYISYIAFQDFNITKAKMKDKKDSYDLSLSGDFVLGAESDGIDILYEDLTVTIGYFVETIPTGAFQWDAVEENYQYIGVSGGITQFVLKQNGKFSCKADGLNLDPIKFGVSVYVAVQIGDDLGETEVIFDIK